MDGDDINVTGNTCPRGADYAKKEVLSPTRIVTSSIKVNDGVIARVSVKTKSDIPKSKIFEVMKEIQAVRIDAPVALGQVLIADCAGTGVEIIATKDVPRI